MYKISKETWDKNTQSEIEPLTHKHWEEVAWYKDSMELNPLYDLYLQYSELGVLHYYTVRLEEELVGYAIYTLTPSLHYDPHLQANNDIMFVLPEHRKPRVALRLLELATKDLKECGASVITLKLKSDHEFHSLMKHVGYDLMEYNYTKYIGE